MVPACTDTRREIGRKEHPPGLGNGTILCPTIQAPSTPIFGMSHQGQKWKVKEPTAPHGFVHDSMGPGGKVEWLNRVV